MGRSYFVCNKDNSFILVLSAKIGIVGLGLRVA